MNILVYAHSFAPRIGGAEAWAMLLAQGLSTRLASEGAASARAEKPGRVVVVTSTPAEEGFDRTLGFAVVRRPGFWKLLRLVRGADIVQLAGPAFLPLLFGLLLRKKVAITHHGYLACCPNGLLFYEPTQTACPGHFLAKHYGECLRCNALHQGWAASLRLLLLTFPRRLMTRRVAANIHVTRHVLARQQLPQSHVIYNGVEDSLGRARPAAGQSASAPGQTIVFAYLGRFVSAKGLPLLLDATRRLQDAGCPFRVKLIGDGPELAKLKALAESLGVSNRVEFTGFLTGAELEAAVADVAAVVMPSLWEETAGLAAVEQMMRGRLVIAADIGGLGEVVAGTGLKFPPCDAADLAACMRRVVEHPEIVAEMGATARARALECFHNEAMVEQHWQLYHRL